MKGITSIEQQPTSPANRNRKLRGVAMPQTSSLTPLPHTNISSNSNAHTHKHHYTTTLAHTVTLSSKQKQEAAAAAAHRTKLRQKAEQAALRIREQKESNKQAELLRKHTDVSERSDIWKHGKMLTSSIQLCIKAYLQRCFLIGITRK